MPINRAFPFVLCSCLKLCCFPFFSCYLCAFCYSLVTRFLNVNTYICGGNKLVITK